MSDRKHHWENVYRNKSPDSVSWFQQEPTLSLSLISRAGLSLDAPIIDVGGGASLLVDKLCDAAYSNISVLDVSGNALAHARKRLGSKEKAVHWFEKDVTRFRPPHRFTLWHDRAVFHFLTNRSDRESYVRVLNKALEPRGTLVIMAFALDGPARCSGLDIVQYDAEKLTAELGEGFELEETGNEVHLTPAGDQQKFAYFRFKYL